MSDGKRLPRLTKKSSRRNTPVVLVGLALILGGGLVAAILWNTNSERSQLLVSASELQPGQIITQDDFKVANIAADSDVSSIPRSELDSLVGLRTRSFVGKGVVVSRSMFADTSEVPDGKALFGAVLKVERYPSGLVAGDQVLLIYTANDGPEEIGTARVEGISTVDGSFDSDLKAQLLIDQSAVDEVANASANKRLTLVRIEQ